MPSWFARWASLLLLCLISSNVAQAAAPISAYARMTNFDHLALSPDGSRYAGVVGDEIRTVVQIASLPGNDVLVQSPFEKASVVALSWAGPDYLIATTRAVQPRKDGLLSVVYFVQKFDVKKRRWSQLLDNSDIYLSFVSKPAETRVVDGRPYAFLNGYSRNGRGGNALLALLKVDLDSGQVKLTEEGNASTIGWALDSAGRAVARADFDDRQGAWTLFGHQPPSSKWSLLETVQDRVDVPSLLSVGATDNEVLYSKPINGIWVVHSRNLASGDAAIFDTDDSGRLMADSFTGRQVARGYDRESAVETVFVDPNDQKLWLNVMKAWPGEVVRFLDWSQDRNVVRVGVSGRRSGIGVFIVDRKARTAQRLLDDMPGLVAADYAEQRPIRFKASDCVEVPAYLTLPPGKPEKALPLIVLAPGGRVSVGYDWQAQALASRGYAVLQPQPRGSSGFGEAYIAAGTGEWGGKQISDLTDGVRSLARDGIIDPARVCVAGTYFAGSQALLAASRDQGVYRCAASIFGVHDFRKRFELYRDLAGPGGDSEAYRQLRRMLGVAVPADPRLDELSPINRVAAISVPVLLMQLKRALPQGDDMAAAFKRAGKPVERATVTADDWLNSNPGRIQMIEGLIGFVEKHNPPGPTAQ